MVQTPHLPEYTSHTALLTVTAPLSMVSSLCHPSAGMDLRRWGVALSWLPSFRVRKGRILEDAWG